MLHDIEHMKAQAATGISALSVGPGADLAAVMQSVGNKVCILGNVDPIKVLLQSDAEKVYEESKKIIEIGKQNGGYIFNSGEMVPRDVPEENIKAMVKAGRDFGKF